MFSIRVSGGPIVPSMCRMEIVCSGVDLWIVDSSHKSPSPINPFFPAFLSFVCFARHGGKTGSPMDVSILSFFISEERFSQVVYEITSRSSWDGSSVDDEEGPVPLLAI